MSLLAILISLILEKLLPPLHRLRSLAWIESYHQWMSAKLGCRKRWQGIPCLLSIIFLPLIAIAVIQYFLNDLLVFFSFVFSILVLTYCLGPKDKRQLAQEYLVAEEREESDNANTKAKAILQDIVSCTTSAPLPDSKSARARALIDCLLIQTHEQLLAILFWFVILGPMGAALYRLTVELQQAGQRLDATENRDTEFLSAVTRLHYVLAWIPSRLTALSYAVMGSFVHALHAWNNTPHTDTINSYADTDNSSASRNNPESHHLLLHIGQASLQIDNHPPQDTAQHNDAIRETLELCGRSIVAWVTIVALMTMAGWAS